MTKEVETKICEFCESQYKLSYDREQVSGFPKYCSFCGESWIDNTDSNEDYDNDGAGC